MVGSGKLIGGRLYDRDIPGMSDMSDTTEITDMTEILGMAARPLLSPSMNLSRYEHFLGQSAAIHYTLGA